ncbi:MAG: hypothetical protein LBQ64_04045 [Bacteroidales bacterium]|nr:hypothetical protein [Bacteroidales bacterium]
MVCRHLPQQRRNISFYVRCLNAELKMSDYKFLITSLERLISTCNEYNMQVFSEPYR